MREIKRESDFTLARGGSTRTDSFGYNARSELTSATLGSDAYAYAFDNVGNRSAATEAGTQFAYVTNELNQYSGIASPGEATRLHASLTSRLSESFQRKFSFQGFRKAAGKSRPQKTSFYFYDFQ